MKKIFVIGMWHLGCVTAACLANSGYKKVFCYDYDKQIRDNLKNKILPINEPWLSELFNKVDISVEDDLKKIKECDFVYIAFDTPLDNHNMPDLTNIFQTIGDIIPYLEKQIIIISSQLPVETSDDLLEILRINKKQNEICYTPENLRLGKAIDCFMHPDRMIFGLSNPKIQPKIEELFSFIKTGKKFEFTTLKVAEMSKHVLNAYLATMISFSADISDFCEEKGINAHEVMRLLKLDERVSNKAPLEPGLGFSGGTLKRDLQVLRYMSEGRYLLLDAVYNVNENRSWKIPQMLLKNYDYIKVGILGVTYKKGTDTLRDSPALDLITKMKGRGTKFSFYDPVFKGTIPGTKKCLSVKELADNSDAVVIFTDYDEFKEVTKSKTKFIIDTKYLLKDINVKQDYYVIGDKQ